MASARPRHARTGLLLSAAVRSQCAAASLSSSAERGPTSQVPASPLTIQARMKLAYVSFGTARNTLADSVLSSSSFYHSGFATSAHSSSRSMPKAFAVA